MILLKLKYPLKQHRCKLKIGKFTYANCSVEELNTLPLNSSKRLSVSIKNSRNCKNLVTYQNTI